MIENIAWENILATATDLSVVCEIYDADAVPSDDGFDPNDAIGCFAAVSGISFEGVSYTRLVKKFGTVNRKLGPESNTASVEFANLDNQISNFEFDNGFEGLIKVIRLISRSESVSLDLSQILFTGRCQKPASGSKMSLSITADWILGGLDVQVPRRKFTKEDQDGRVSTDPEFEGFLFIPQYGTTSYSVRVKRGGIAGFFGFKKTVQKTLAWSSFSDLDANKCVPLILGMSQILGTHIGYEDVGSYIKLRTAFCDGPIFGFQNVRSLDARMPLNMLAYAESNGLVGAANGDDPTWAAPGYYSRTANIRGEAINSAVDEVEPAPEIAAVIIAMLMTIPDDSGDWILNDEWSDNAAAHEWFLLTSDDYFKLDENWLEASDFAETFNYNAGLIIDRSLTDFLFITEG